MHTKTLLSVALLLVLGACGDDDATSTTASTVAVTTTTLAPATTTSAATTTTGAETTTTTDAGTTTTVATTGQYLTTADDELGEILVDQYGFTLYLFLPDNQSTPTCNGTCALTWPAFVDDGDGEFGAGAGIDPELLGFVERNDGSIQVTYNGWPLYYYLPDVTPGDTRGQGIGSNWWAVDDDGEPVMD